jgi:hypothetical protein
MIVYAGFAVAAPGMYMLCAGARGGEGRNELVREFFAQELWARILNREVPGIKVL